MRATTILSASLAGAMALGGVAHAQPWAHLESQRLHAIHVNVFRPLDAPTLRSEALTPSTVDQAEGTAELSMFVGELEAIVDPSGVVTPEEGGCVSILVGQVIDEGCGALTVDRDDVAGTTRVSGVLETTAYEYIPDPFSFEELGPSSITVDLVFRAGEVAQPSPYTSWAAGFCGWPPETKAVFVDARPELQRVAPGAGTLRSAAAGPIDIGQVEPLMVDAFGALAAGGYDACL